MCYLISDDAVRVCSLSGHSISSNTPPQTARRRAFSPPQTASRSPMA